MRSSWRGGRNGRTATRPQNGRWRPAPGPGTRSRLTEPWKVRVGPEDGHGRGQTCAAETGPAWSLDEVMLPGRRVTQRSGRGPGSPSSSRPSGGCTPASPAERPPVGAPHSHPWNPHRRSSAAVKRLTSFAHKQPARPASGRNRRAERRRATRDRPPSDSQ